MSGRTVRYAVVLRPEDNESVEAAYLFGPFFSLEQADGEALRWNRHNEVAGWFASVEPMGGLDALRRWTPESAAARTLLPRRPMLGGS